MYAIETLPMLSKLHVNTVNMKHLLHRVSFAQTMRINILGYCPHMAVIAATTLTIAHAMSCHAKRCMLVHDVPQFKKKRLSRSIVLLLESFGERDVNPISHLSITPSQVQSAYPLIIHNNPSHQPIASWSQRPSFDDLSTGMLESLSTCQPMLTQMQFLHTDILEGHLHRREQVDHVVEAHRTGK